MSPQSVQLPDGRIIRCCNYPSIGASSESAQDKLTGRVFKAGSIAAAGEGTIKTWVESARPTLNFSSFGYFIVDWKAPIWPSTGASRGYIKCPVNKILHAFCLSMTYGPCTIEAREVNAADYNTDTVNWNTQPALGSVLYTWTQAVANIWVEIPTGTLGAICLKIVTESGSDQRTGWAGDYYGFGKDLYFTDP